MSDQDRVPRMFAALIRHGDYHQLPDTPSAHQPFPLTVKGERQAAEAVDRLRSVCLEKGWALCSSVNSSEQLRAWQTADIIAKGLHQRCSQPFDLESFPELAERSMGSAANLSLQQIEDIVKQDPRCSALPKDWKANSHFCLPLPGAESLMAAGARVAAHLISQMKDLARTADTDTLKIFVGHGASFRHAAYHLGLLSFDQIGQLSMYHAQPVLLEYLPSGEWRHESGAWKVRGPSHQAAPID